MNRLWSDFRGQPEQQMFVVLATSVLVLGAALVLEKVYGYLPCELCLKERYAYYAAVVLSIAASCAFRFGRAELAAGLIGLVGLGLLANAGLGLYHAGVEWHWWPGPSTCTGSGPGLATSSEDLLKALQNENVVPCDRPALKVLGFSLAAWNIPIGLALGALALTASWGFRRRKTAV